MHSINSECHVPLSHYDHVFVWSVPSFRRAGHVEHPAETRQKPVHYLIGALVCVHPSNHRMTFFSALSKRDHSVTAYGKTRCVRLEVGPRTRFTLPTHIRKEIKTRVSWLRRGNPFLCDRGKSEVKRKKTSLRAKEVGIFQLARLARRGKRV